MNIQAAPSRASRLAERAARRAENQVLPSERPTAEKYFTRKRRVLWARILLLLGLSVFIPYRMWTNAPDPIPLPTSTAGVVIAAAQDASAWPRDGGDIGMTRRTAASPAMQGSVAWRASLNSGITTPPIVANGIVYVGVQAAALVAIEASTGRELWRAPVAGQLDASPTYADGRLYTVYRDGTVAALDAKTGAEIWRSDFGPTFATSALVEGGIVYASSLGDVRALDAATGAELWSRRVDDETVSATAPVVAPHDFVAANYKQAMVFSRVTGEQVFHYSVRQPLHLLVDGNQTFIISRDRAVAFGLDQRRPWWDPFRLIWGQLWIFGMAPTPPDQPAHWVQAISRNALEPALTEDGAFVVAHATGRVVAYDRYTGEGRWKVEGKQLALGPIASPAGLVLLESEALVVRDAKTGNEVARRAFPGEQLRGVALTSGGTYITNDRGEVIALR